MNQKKWSKKDEKEYAVFHDDPDWLQVISEKNMPVNKSWHSFGF
jgi:hypothetical protein